MNRIEKAKEFRSTINANIIATRKLIRVDDLTEGELSEMINLYEHYQINHAYNVGEIFKHENKLYKVIQTHTSQADWLPGENPALYLDIMPENVIPEWVQPTGAHDAYNIGNKVIWTDGKVYKSLINANTYSPTEYPQGWQQVVSE